MNDFPIVSWKFCVRSLRGKTVKQIGTDLALSEKTVSTYRTRLLEKMQMHSNAELIQYAIREGLVD
jgi:two-component system invasion response regulator UvrY